MKLSVVCFFLLFFSGSQNTGLSSLQHWFNAWELMSKELKIPKTAPPEFVFYDSVYVYSTSDVTAPTAQSINGPKFFGEALPWKKMEHKGELTLPDGQKVPVALMSFASPSKNGKGFFVMAAPSFWRSAGVTSSELGLDNLLTGVFLHEFSHTRQFNGFGAMIDSIGIKHTFKDVEFNDDIVQTYFKKDSGYVAMFRNETDKFYEAAFAKKLAEAKSRAKSGLQSLELRQATYFRGEQAVLKQLDDIFLSMEGMGQYLAVAWLVHPKGGNVPFDKAVKGFRRGRNQWSQEQGLALFLALKRLTKPNWYKDMFSDKPTDIITLLQKAVK